VAGEYIDVLAGTVSKRWPGVAIHTSVQFGAPAARIAETANKVGAALVYMATHGRTGLSRAVMGSVAGQVLEHGNTPLVSGSVESSPPKGIGPATAAKEVVVHA
jgi:nucleotide-binding universal stress UspA family protein